jgi:hypothetical protein
LAAAFVAALVSAHGGETLLPNSAFDANAAGWYWEDWSAAGSAAGFDGSNNSVVTGGAAGSGSLKLVAAFNGNPGYQQAVYTVPLPAAQNFNGKVGAVSFDLKIDAGSTARADGDYGLLEVILRQGNNWDWVGLPGTRLNGNDWQRVTFQVPKDGVDSIRAITLKLGENDFLGPVTLNVDNIALITNPDDVWITGIDNGTVDTAPAGWSWENWSAQGVVSYDPADTHGRSTSGTISLDHQFANSPGTYQQSVFTYPLPAEVDAATAYSTINLDVKVDPASVPREGGDYGYWEVILRNGNNWDWLPTDIDGASGTRITDNEWHHLSFKVPKAANSIRALTFKTGENSLLGPVILKVDNISWTRSTAPPPAPTLSLAKAKGGLTLVTTSSDQYGRHNIYTTDNTFTFVDTAELVSYSFTLDTFPDATAYPGFQAHIFLVPGSPGNEQSPDWNEPTVIFMDIRAGANGAGTATFRIKTDQPAGNSELYAAGLTTVSSASVVGTWTLTAAGNIFTMTTPDGTVSNAIDIGAEAAGLFAADPLQLRAYFGVQPNSNANKGQGVHVGKVEIKKGATILLSDKFDGAELDLTKWTPNANPGGVQFVSPADASFILNWTLPDTGFKVQISTSLATPSWTDLDVSAVTATIGASKQAIIPKADLPDSPQLYFRMVQPPLPPPP